MHFAVVFCGEKRYSILRAIFYSLYSLMDFVLHCLIAKNVIYILRELFYSLYSLMHFALQCLIAKYIIAFLEHLFHSLYRLMHFATQSCSEKRYTNSQNYILFTIVFLTSLCSLIAKDVTYASLTTLLYVINTIISQFNVTNTET